MESKIRFMTEGRLKIKSMMLDELKVQSDKFFDCDALVASLALDPRIGWSNSDPIYNDNLLDKAVVS